MRDLWIEVGRGPDSTRLPLGSGSIVLGAAGDVSVTGAGSDHLVVLGEPPRARFDGDGEPPRRRGADLPVRTEVPLEVGDVLRWHGTEVRLGRSEAVLESMDDSELSEVTSMDEGTETAGGSDWRRVKAGLLVELGLADKGAARSAQDAIRERRFDPEAAADEILTRSQVAADEPKLRQRTGRLMRDLVMAPTQRGARGAGRKSREAARSGLAWLVAQFTVVSLVALLLSVGLLVARLKWDFSVDDVLDRGLSLLPESVVSGD